MAKGATYTPLAEIVPTVDEPPLTAFTDHVTPVVAVPLTKVLHLKSAVTALPDGTVIGYLPLVDDPTLFPQFIPVPEESGAHVVLLGDSIFDNGDYVKPKPAVIEQLKKALPKGWKTTLAAVDGWTLNQSRRVFGCSAGSWPLTQFAIETWTFASPDQG